MRKTAYFLYSKSQKGDNSHKNWRKINANRTWFVVQQKEVICKISAQYDNACKIAENEWDRRTDGQNDGQSANL